ncbi:lactate utilization protein B/C [Flavobacterium sp.]|uniref:lactate utilization protein B/C n=1 Tax=Flavobacterium sp. TaxID=239 RepID=UPI0022C46E0B|nr:lactate utilization protein B/C [Flavobacterium sp.]MCZ8229094.1 lactate utilization protein B/C [Flavobacterium sp.]
MSLFRKFFSSGHTNSDEEKESQKLSFEQNIPIDEHFIFNFKRNGGKFLYCDSMSEVNEQFENILEENDWFEGEAICYESTLFPLLKENNILFDNPQNPNFLLATCENLVADEGSISFSSNQIKQKKPNELPVNMVIIAYPSQIIPSKSEILSAIKNKYKREYPSNITTIKYFEKAQEEDFTQYGSAAKNLYLILLEDL